MGNNQSCDAECTNNIWKTSAAIGAVAMSLPLLYQIIVTMLYHLAHQQCMKQKATSSNISSSSNIAPNLQTRTLPRTMNVESSTMSKFAWAGATIVVLLAIGVASYFIFQALQKQKKAKLDSIAKRESESDSPETNDTDAQEYAVKTSNGCSIPLPKTDTGECVLSEYGKGIEKRINRSNMSIGCERQKSGMACKQKYWPREKGACVYKGSTPNLAQKCAQFTEKEECVNQKNLETVSPFQQDNEYWYFTKKNKEDIKNAKCQGCTNYVSAFKAWTSRWQQGLIDKSMYPGDNDSQKKIAQKEIDYCYKMCGMEILGARPQL